MGWAGGVRQSRWSCGGLVPAPPAAAGPQECVFGRVLEAALLSAAHPALHTPQSCRTGAGAREWEVRMLRQQRHRASVRVVPELRWDTDHDINHQD